MSDLVGTQIVGFLMHRLNYNVYENSDNQTDFMDDYLSTSVGRDFEVQPVDTATYNHVSHENSTDIVDISANITSNAVILNEHTYSMPDSILSFIG